MKKLFSVMLVIAMLACMLPVFAVSAATEGQVPIAKKTDGTVLSGAATEPNLKSWTISDTELYLDQGKDQGYFIFNDTMKEGRLEATLVKNKTNNSCDGIVFGLSDNDNMNFWESGVSFYWLHIDENVNLRLTRVGDNANYTNSGNWHDLKQGADVVDLDDTKGMNIEDGITIAAEWDGEGHIKCYANDELIYDYDDSADPFTGSRYGVRMKEKAVFGSTFTSIVAGYPVQEPTPTPNPNPNPKPAPTGDMTALAVAVATIALIGTGVIVSKKRSFN